MDVAHSQFLRQ